MDFPFHQTYRLDDYNADLAPSVFFGMYRFEDWQIYYHHDAVALCFWTGQDALSCDKWIYGHFNFTAHPMVKERLNSFGIDCQLVKPATFLNTVQPQKLGKRIYAHCPDSALDYHGWAVINKLKDDGYDIIIGDGKLTQEQWRTGGADLIYSLCFIGLCLSEFAGGGGSIIEMGLRGMRVVTNVFDLPNCIPWNSLEDIMQAIEDERKLIGTTNEKLANQVWNDLDHQHKWLEI